MTHSSAPLPPGLGSLAQAEGYLSQAEWTVMKTPECSQTVRHQLHRNLGRLYTATENLEGALLHFANDVSVKAYQWSNLPVLQNHRFTMEVEL